MKKMQSPLVSVIIPALNADKFIAETIKSVLGQSMNDIELIVINDGSTDETQKVVEATFAEYSDSRLTLISRENRGMCRSLNEGLALSSGKYFAYVGADDVWDTRKLEIQVEELERTGLLACYTDCFVINAPGQIVTRLGLQYPYRGGDIYYDLVRARFQPPSPTNLFRRDLVERIGNFNESHIWEDRDFWIRIARDHEVVFVDSPMASYRIHSSNGSLGNLDNMYRYAHQVLDAAIERDPGLAAWRTRLMADIDAFQAASNYEKLDLAKARKFALASLRQNPFGRLAWRTFVLSFLGKAMISKVRSSRRSKQGVEVQRHR